MQVGITTALRSRSYALGAKLGGFLARLSYGEPSVKTMWRGSRRLDVIAAAWLLLHYFTSNADLFSYG